MVFVIVLVFFLVFVLRFFVVAATEGAELELVTVLMAILEAIPGVLVVGTGTRSGIFGDGWVSVELVISSPWTPKQYTIPSLLTWIAESNRGKMAEVNVSLQMPT